jgi:hypothetical protein
MKSYAAQIADCLGAWRQGDPDGSAAWHTLVEMDDAAVPELIGVFKAESDASVREFLVEVIWQHREPSTIAFLGQALNDPEPVVWQQALDGLVTLASPAALRVLYATRDSAAGDFRSWIEEAIRQVEQAIGQR